MELTSLGATAILGVLGLFFPGKLGLLPPWVSRSHCLIAATCGCSCIPAMGFPAQ